MKQDSKNTNGNEALNIKGAGNIDITISIIRSLTPNVKQEEMNISPINASHHLISKWKVYDLIKEEIERPLDEVQDQPKGAGRPITTKDYSQEALFEHILYKFAALLKKVKLHPSLTSRRKRTDSEFSKVICFVKKVPHFLSEVLRTGKYYKTSYEQDKEKIIK